MTRLSKLQITSLLKTMCSSHKRENISMKEQAITLELQLSLLTNVEAANQAKKRPLALDSDMETSPERTRV